MFKTLIGIPLLTENSAPDFRVKLNLSSYVVEVEWKNLDTHPPFIVSLVENRTR